MRKASPDGGVNTQTHIAGYGYMLYIFIGTFDAVTQRVQLHRRMAKKYVERGDAAI